MIGAYALGWQTLPPPLRRGRCRGEATMDGDGAGGGHSAAHPTPRPSAGTLPCEGREGRQARSAPFKALLAAVLLALLPQAPAFAGETIPVPTITIYPGDIIRDAMLATRELPEDFAGRGATILSKDALIGKTARRTLLPNLPIPYNAIGEPKVVTVGAMVRVVFVEGGLTISTYGSALKAGSVGDVIPVRNNESGLTVSGRVEQDGTVRVSDG